MRRALYLAVVILLWSISSPFAQNKEGVERIDRHKSFAELMSVFENWGLDRNVQNQIKQFSPRIASDLEYAGSGGVLIVVRLEKFQTESGTFRRLIGGNVDYVGIGVTDYDAEIANIAKSKLEAGVTPGSMFDAEASTAYWFSKSGSDFTVSEKPLSWLRGEVLNEIVDRKRRSYDWRVARTAELTRLAEVVRNRIDDGQESSTISALLRSRTEALAKQAEINTALREALEGALAAERQQEALKAISFLVDYASFVTQFASSPEQSNASPMTREAAQARLEQIENEANAKAKQLAEEMQQADDTTFNFNLRLELELRQRKAPTDNLPPLQAPVVNPPPD
ncbi:hypothetical protein [Inquilinus sp. OTU3971]|uniref:hypothetical protein n=1 Tax=Inquilinus sp. OTU3971 TaxID=3043855 RepID=UPI00313E251C